MGLLNYLISLFAEGKIVHKINNLPTLPFAGMTGTVMIDDKGDRDPDYWMWFFGPGQEQYKPFMKILLTKPPGEQVRRRGLPPYQYSVKIHFETFWLYVSN